MNSAEFGSEPHWQAFKCQEGDAVMMASRRLMNITIIIDMINDSRNNSYVDHSTTLANIHYLIRMCL